MNKDIYLNDISDFSQWNDNTAPSNIWQGMQGAFARTFDGNGHTIYGMYIKNSDDNTGFFRATSKTREAVSFRNTYVSGQNNVGCIVGRAFMLNCSNIVISGTVKGKNNVGGILGYYNSEHSGASHYGGSITITNCKVSKAKFKKWLKKKTNGEKEKKLGKLYKNTAKNRNKYLK